MATKIIQPQISSSHLIPQNPKIKISINSILSSNPRCIYPRFKLYPSGFKPNFSLRASAEEQSSNVLDNEKDTIAFTKANIYQAVEGINRGAFGVTSTKKREIEDLVMQLESLNPTPNPTLNLDKVSGCWKLIYSTITILGSKRTKLGLRDFISLGDFLQIIDVAEGKAVNVIKFSARGLNLLNGQLTIQASFSFASQSRVNIKYDNSHITPDQLMNLFKKNYDLLLSIFNPEGWLDITYLDDTLRIGRDDKGSIFILERSSDD